MGAPQGFNDPGRNITMHASRIVLVLIVALFCGVPLPAGEKNRGKGPKKTPPGWSKGKKTGWGKDNLPPGLARKQADGLRQKAKDKGLSDTEADAVVDAVARHVGKGNRAEEILDAIEGLLGEPDRGREEAVRGIKDWIARKTEETLQLP